MNAERLLAHYERIADAPDAIARLRRFILDLAVRGKLVPQDASDEPASKLLKRIATEKVRLMEAGTYVSAEPTKSTRSRSLCDLPNWEWARLDAVVAMSRWHARINRVELLIARTPVFVLAISLLRIVGITRTCILSEDKDCDKGDLIFAWSAYSAPFNGAAIRSYVTIISGRLSFIARSTSISFTSTIFLLRKRVRSAEAGHGVSMIHMTKEEDGIFFKFPSHLSPSSTASSPRSMN